MPTVLLFCEKVPFNDGKINIDKKRWGKKKLIRIGGTKKYVTTGLCNILPLS